MNEPNRVDLGLALLSVATKPGEKHTLHDISVWCDCTVGNIERIEKQALRKIRRHLANDEKLRRELENSCNE